MGGQNERFRQKLEEVISGMRRRFADCLVQAAGEGELSPALDPDETAEFILSAWQGTLMQMKVTQSAKPYQVFDKLVFQRLLNPQIQENHPSPAA